MPPEAPQDTTSMSLEVSRGNDADESPVGSKVVNNNGFFVRFSRLEKSVEVREATSGLLRSSIASKSTTTIPEPSSKPSTKRILNQVSGYAAPGQVLALMGPSGSSKTTLLNVLSGRSSYDAGVITINGEQVTNSSMKRLMSKIAYVKQSDIFFEHLTVRDQLTYTALLRLHSSLPKSEKHAEVNRLIKLLRLSNVADSPIMLLSGGEKKRVNICTELLTDPTVLLLDEPTSGLDSTSAVALLQTLQNLAREHGKTVVTSIHQPSSAVFRSFDRLLMLAEGNVVYFGTPVDSMSYLRQHQFTCPDGYNAADHWMDLLVVDSSLEEERNEASKMEPSTLENTSEEEAVAHDTPRKYLIASWDGEVVAQQVEAALVEDDDSASQVTSFSNVQKYNTSWVSQFAVLTHRSLKNSRSAIFTTLNLIKSAAIGLVAGLLWFQIDYTESAVFDRSSYYFFTMTFWVFDSMFESLMAFPSERDVILKERASASYQLSAYFMAKTISEAPTRLVLPFIYMCISFWMAGVSTSFGVFVGSTGITLMSVLAGESFGLLIGASVYDLERALTVMTVAALALMLLGGFFVDNTPSFVEWAKYLSAFKYSYDGSLQLVFNKDVPCDGSGGLEELCGGADTGFATPEQVIAFLGIQGSVGFNVGLLFVLILVPRYLAYLALRRKKSGDRA